MLLRGGGRSRGSALIIALLAGLIAFVGAVQVRSQAAVEQSLQGQDNTALAFLIDDLHKSNDSLAAQQSRLEAQRNALSRSGAGAAAAVESEAQRLRIAEGLVPVTGPGVVISIDADLQPLDLQDAVNNLRLSGAEVIAINGRRVITGTVIASGSGSVTIDGAGVQGPWTLLAIGDPALLTAEADLLVSSLRADPRVRQAAYRSSPTLRITAVLTQRPFVYGSF